MTFVAHFILEKVVMNVTKMLIMHAKVNYGKLSSILSVVSGPSHAYDAGRLAACQGARSAPRVQTLTPRALAAPADDSAAENTSVSHNSFYI